MGSILGIYLAFGIVSGQLNLFPFLHTFNNYSFVLIDEFLFSLFLLFGLMAWLFWDPSQKKEWISSIKFPVSALILISVFNLGEFYFGINTWEGWEFRNFMWEVFWIIALLIHSAIFGGPLGAILGTGVGYVRSKNFPKAPNAEAEGIRPYRIGLLYPVIFMLIAWPITYFWLYPWLLTSFPNPIGQ